MAEDNSPRICRDEIFGPVAAVIPFDTDEEAVEIANDSRFGLASGVWTRDLARAHRMIRDIESGNVWVNTYLQTRHELPFGGHQGERLRAGLHPRLHVREGGGDHRYARDGTDRWFTRSHAAFRLRPRHREVHSMRGNRGAPTPLRSPQQPQRAPIWVS